MMGLEDIVMLPSSLPWVRGCVASCLFLKVPEGLISGYLQGRSLQGQQLEATTDL